MFPQNRAFMLLFPVQDLSCDLLRQSVDGANGIEVSIPSSK